MDCSSHGPATEMAEERMSGSDSFTTSETYSDDESLPKRHKVCKTAVQCLLGGPKNEAAF